MRWFYSVPANPQQHNRSESGLLFLSLEKGRELGCLGSNPGSITFLTSPRLSSTPHPHQEGVTTAPMAWGHPEASVGYREHAIMLSCVD